MAHLTSPGSYTPAPAPAPCPLHLPLARGEELGRLEGVQEVNRALQEGRGLVEALQGLHLQVLPCTLGSTLHCTSTPLPLHLR